MTKHRQADTTTPVTSVRPLLAMPAGAQRELVWSEHAERTARELGLAVDVPEQTPDASDTAAWAELLAGREVVLTGWGSPRLNEAVLANNRELQFVGHAAGSVAGIVSDALFERNVRIASANRVIGRCVADWAVMMSLIAARQLWDYANVGGSRPLKWIHFPDQVRGLTDVTIGIWGFGDVGQAFADLLAPLRPGGVLVCDPRPLGNLPEPMRQVELNTLFETADIVHLTAPLNEATHSRIDADLLGRMKRGATLINAGRAELVQEDALLAALRRGGIHAILDVFHREPLPEDDPLNALPNVMLTPHSAGQGRFHQMAGEMLREWDRLRRGEPLHHEVKREQALAMTDESLRSR